MFQHVVFVEIFALGHTVAKGKLGQNLFQNTDFKKHFKRAIMPVFHAVFFVGYKAQTKLGKNAFRHGINPEKIFVGGMSAGAYLAAISVMNPFFLKNRQIISTFDRIEPIVNIKFIIFIEKILDITGKMIYIINASVSTLSHQVLNSSERRVNHWTIPDSPREKCKYFVQ